MARDLADELDRGQREAILCRLALAEARSLDLEVAMQTADRALAELEASQADTARAAGFLWSFARELTDAGAPEEHVRPLIERGLSFVGDDRDLHWARLMLVLHPAEPLESGRIHAERWIGYDVEAVRIARASDDELDYAATLELMDWRGTDEAGDLLERCRRWRQPAARIHALSIVARTLLYELGDLRQALGVSRELLAESERAGSLPGTAYALEQLADVAIAFGEFEAGSTNLARARAVAAKLGPAHRVHFIIGLVETRFAMYLDGDWGALARAYERAATDPRLHWRWITIHAAAWAAFAYARAGATREATRLLDDLVPLLEALEPRTLNQNAATALAGEAIWHLGDRSRAARCRELALALVDAGVGDYVMGSHELTLGRMASLLEEHAEASEWFARAQATLLEDGRRPLYAIAVIDHASAMVAARSPAPLGALREAQALAAELGMTPWSERAAGLLAQADATPPAGLTGREAEVLRLLAEGRTNREIADALVLSVHTIERHLANAYRKIGTRNRAEATAFVVRNL
jgi:DNA-binding NarL/FixJ family response regulator